jgi:acetoin utilization protein AcuB
MTQALVKEWMTSPVITGTPDMPLNEARRIFNERHIRALPIMQNDKLVGLINRQVLIRVDLSILGNEVWNLGIDVPDETAADVMKKAILTITPDSTIHNAARVMLENKINALPVIESGKLIGILTSSDLLRFIIAQYPGLNKKITVSDYMTDVVVTVCRDTTLLEAHNVMGLKHIRSLPVVENDALVGLVTRTDLMSSDPSRPAMQKSQETSKMVLAQPVEKVMVTNMVTILPDAELTEAARIMLEKKIHCLPVVKEKGQMLGIITESDLFLMLLQKLN